MNPITSSLVYSFNVPTTHSLYGEKYTNVGGTVMTRKWNHTYVPENWVELWVGMMVSFNPCYTFTASIVDNPSPSTRYNINFMSTPYQKTQHFAWGISSSSGSYFGDGFVGSHVLSSSQYITRSIGIGTSDQSSGLTYTQSVAGTKIAILAEYAQAFELDSYNAGGGVGPVVWPTSDLGKNQYSMNYHLMRFVRNPASYVTTMSMMHLYCDVGYTSKDWNIAATSSALIAECLKQTSWADLVTKLNEYTDVKYLSSTPLGGATNKFFVDETNGGTFDQIFITWKGAYCPIMVTNVVVRPSGSF